MKPRNPSNSDIYYLLGEIKGTLDSIVEMQSKVIYALIALAGATMGLKLWGSPPLQTIMFYTKVFIFVFTALLALGKRSVAKRWYWIFAFALSAGLAQVIDLLTSQEQNVSTTLFLLANISLLMFVWNWGHKE